MLTQGNVSVNLAELIIGEKQRILSELELQPNFNTSSLNELLTDALVSEIITRLETRDIDSPLMRACINPFKLGQVFELIRLTKLCPFTHKSTDDPTHRKISGMYYTPENIIETIVNLSLEKWLKSTHKIEIEDPNAGVARWMELKLIDPACGTGSFLIVSALKLSSEYNKFLLRQTGNIPSKKEFHKRLGLNIIHGIDIDPMAVRICRASLKYHLEIDIDSPAQIHCGDSISGRVRAVGDSDIEIQSGLNNSPTPIHFKETFPNIFSEETGGFHIIVMNPPYGKLRAESNKGIRKDKTEDKMEKKRFENLRKHLRESGMYSHCSGVLNWYKLFIERSMQILAEDGSLGFIVPSTLLCDQTTAGLRELLLSFNLKHLYEIPEKNDFFDSVTQAFCIGVVDLNQDYKGTHFSFGVNSLAEIKNNSPTIDVKSISELTPKVRAIPLTNNRGMELFSIIQEFPKIIDIDNIINLRGEVDLTDYKNLIKDTEGEGARLLRGKHINFFHLDNVESESNGDYIDHRTFLKKINGSKKAKHTRRQRLICKQIANQGMIDRLQFAVAPPNTFLGNSLNYLLWDGDDEEQWTNLLLGLLNSTLLDWRFRITSTNNHVNNYEIDDLPIPIVASNPVIDRKLALIADVAQSMRDCTVDQLFSKRDELDVAVFAAYGVTEKDIELVLRGVGDDDSRIQRLRRMMNDEEKE